jgi:sorting nexin-1/2
VNTNTNHPDLPFSEFSVLRRFNDFVWLHDQLNFSHPGAIVPPLPEKQAVGRFTPEFVECRRRALEKFMARITKHTVLKNSRCLNAFLQTDDAQFLQAKEQFRLEREKAAGSLTSWLENKVNALTSSNSQAGLEKNAADLKFEEILQYITHLETQMSSVSKHTTTLVKHNRVMANALFEFGQAFTWLGQSEGDALGAALTQMGNTADQLSVLATENAEAESILLDEPLEEYVRLLSSVKIAMKRRQDKKNAYVNAILDLEAKQAAYNKVLGVAGKEESANAKLALVEKSQSLVDNTRLEYEEVSERLLEEFDRFKREKAEDVKLILLNYVNLQVTRSLLPHPFSSFSPSHTPSSH